jgi:hypothetical protein
MSQALEEAQALLPQPIADNCTRAIAAAILKVAAAGERDPVRLRTRAMSALESEGGARCRGAVGDAFGLEVGFFGNEASASGDLAHAAWCARVGRILTSRTAQKMPYFEATPGFGGRTGGWP